MDLTVLGQVTHALGWQLWIGKTLLSSHTQCSTPHLKLKQIARSQSEGLILIHPIYAISTNLYS